MPIHCQSVHVTRTHLNCLAIRWNEIAVKGSLRLAALNVMGEESISATLEGSNMTGWLLLVAPVCMTRITWRYSLAILDWAHVVDVKAGRVPVYLPKQTDSQR